MSSNIEYLMQLHRGGVITNDDLREGRTNCETFSDIIMSTQQHALRMYLARQLKW